MSLIDSCKPFVSSWDIEIQEFSTLWPTLTWTWNFCQKEEYLNVFYVWISVQVSNIPNTKYIVVLLYMFILLILGILLYFKYTFILLSILLYLKVYLCIDNNFACLFVFSLCFCSRAHQVELSIGFPNFLNTSSICVTQDIWWGSQCATRRHVLWKGEIVRRTFSRQSKTSF